MAQYLLSEFPASERSLHVSELSSLRLDKAWILLKLMIWSGCMFVSGGGCQYLALLQQRKGNTEFIIEI